MINKQVYVLEVTNTSNLLLEYEKVPKLKDKKVLRKGVLHGRLLERPPLGRYTSTVNYKNYSFSSLQLDLKKKPNLIIFYFKDNSTTATSFMSAIHLYANPIIETLESLKKITLSKIPPILILSDTKLSKFNRSTNLNMILIKELLERYSYHSKTKLNITLGDIDTRISLINSLL